MNALLTSLPKSAKLWLVVLLVALALAAFEQAWAKHRAQATEPGRGAEWIWAAGVDVGHQSRKPQPSAFYAWRDMDLQQIPQVAWLEIVADESYRLFINGHWLGANTYHQNDPADLYRIEKFLRPGINRILVELRSSRGVGGLLASLRAEKRERVILRSGRGWNCTEQFEYALFDPRQLVVGGAPCQVWGGYAIGRWRVASAEERPLPAPPIAAHRVRNTSPKAHWVDLKPTRRQFPRLGPFLVFDWGKVVTGHLTLFLDAATEPGLLYCNAEYPDPDRDPITLVVRPIPGTLQWTSTQALRFRYCLSVGLPITAAPRVEPAPIEAPLEKEPQGVWGIEPPLKPIAEAPPPVWERVREELRRNRSLRNP